MDLHSLTDKILAHFSHTPTENQADAIQALAMFVLGGEDRSIFILKGFAGTGKTSVVSALINALKEAERSVVLLAPTGRAAKVLATYSHQSATTIHKGIYRQRIAGEVGGAFSLDYCRHRDTLFVVDEASMISCEPNEGSFGSGNLLEDLLKYVSQGYGNTILFVGDNAQLPPIGEEFSPALESRYLESCGYTVYGGQLCDVVRQSLDSGILYNATYLRTLLFSDHTLGLFPEITTDGFPDIRKITSETLIDDIDASYREYGEEDTIIITRSNKRATEFNLGIRSRVLWREEEISRGDMVMVVKNNYYWAKGIERLDFIANGDIAQVRRVRKMQEMYGFRFADLELYFPDYDAEIEVKVLLDTITSESPSLSRTEMMKLYKAVEEDYMDVPLMRDRRKKMRDDPFLNALQIKFAYAVTCHKAQGGQWSAVFLDNGYLTTDMIDADYYRWLYTAFTRATERIYLINWTVSK